MALTLPLGSPSGLLGKLQPYLRRPRLWQTILFPLLIFILFLATSASPYPVPASGSDKINHIMAFICLGGLACLSYPRLGTLLLLTLLTGYGLAIEVIQALLPYREFSLLDLLADFGGAVVGLALGRLVLHRAGRADRAPSRQ